MTAVAAPLSFQQNNKIAWSTANGNDYGAATNPPAEEGSKMFPPGPRKTLQRQNSSSSIASSNSSTSTISTNSVQTNGTSVTSGDAANWARKKPTRAIWPQGKAEAATGITTARPQPVSSATSGPTASSAISALHAPLLPSQQMANGTAQPNGSVRNQPQAEQPAILHLVPINGTFDRKTITVPYYPDVLRIGRQTNQKTVPTAANGYFDSKVLSRQHAEVYADRQGRIFIRDVKSSNGTFVNGMRLSPENKESDPRELREQDVLELGIDIVSEDQKTVVHHKVAAKVEHAGIYGQGGDGLNFGDLDPSSGNGMAGGAPLKRTGSQVSMNGRVPTILAGQAALNAGMMGQPPHARNWLNPITTEHMVKKLNAEMKLAQQQSQDLARARQCIEAMLGVNVKSPDREAKQNSEKGRPSPIKSKNDLKAQFSEPPAPPPQAPLPEKPDVARALADPVILPLLRRGDTTRPASAASSPTRTDHSGDILRLCEELKLTKGELSTQTEKMKSLESQLAQEKTARESAEERAQRLEKSEDLENATDDLPDDDKHDLPNSKSAAQESKSAGAADLQLQLDRLRASMDEMKQQMETYRQRAETAETERDEARQTLAEMVEQKRAENAAKGSVSRSNSKGRRSPSKLDKDSNQKISSTANGHAVRPTTPTSPTAVTLLEKAGLEDSAQPITVEQARMLQQIINQEVLGGASFEQAEQSGGEGVMMYHGRPLSAAALVVIVGVVMMGWMNSWPKLER